MSVTKYVAFLMLCKFLGVYATPNSAPTTSPTSAPTSAATSAPSSAPSDDAKPTSTAAPTPATTPATTLETTPTTTSSAGGVGNGTNTTEAPIVSAPVTRFTTTLGLTKAADFNSDDYIASIANTTGVPAANVDVVVEFVVKVSYTFPDSIEEADVKKAAADMAGVAESKVSVTFAAARRLKNEKNLGRRLARTANVEIRTDDASKADTISTDAADTSKIVSSITSTSGKAITTADVSVAQAPALEVEVTTVVTSSTATAVEPPSSAELTAKLKEVSGKDFTVEVGEPEYTYPATTTTVVYGESSDARKGATQCITGVSSILLALFLSA